MKYLFERLMEREPGDVGPEVFDLKQAVRDNVQRVLGTRVVADTQADLDVLACGLPSVVEIARDNRSGYERYAARAQRLIEHYEPRLQAPRVDVLAGDDAPYRLVVNAKLAGADGVEDMRFPILVEDAG